MGAGRRVTIAVPTWVDRSSVITRKYVVLSSGGRTRTPNRWTRTTCVADYTTPEGSQDFSALCPTAHTPIVVR